MPLSRIRSYLAAVEGCTRDLWPTLQLRRQVSILKLLELILDLLLLFLSDWATIVVIVNVLLSRVDH